MNKTTTERLLFAAKDIWSGYHVHPFVAGIADGSLDREKFKYYMMQDYLYLIEYAKVFAVGVAKAREIETMRVFAGSVYNILDGEMDIHKGYMQRLGISLDEAELARAALDNIAYTSYMLRVAYDDGSAEIAAAILSCALSYEVIAKEMVRSNPDSAEHEFYGEWVSGYANLEYAKANQKLIELLEYLTAEYSESQLRRLEDIFVACSRYEAAFWNMAWEMRV